MSLMEIELQKEGHFQGVSKELFKKLNPFVWVIKLMGIEKGAVRLMYLTGFGVRNDGSDCLIMTCAHGNYSNWSNQVFKARRLLGDKGFEFNALIVDIKPRWDVCVMKIVGLGSCKEDWVTFGSGLVDEAEKVICIGHAKELVGSCLVGHAAYACTNEVELEYENVDLCHTFDSEAMTTTPPYRIMGNIWNSDYFNLARQRDRLEGRGKVNRNFEMNLQPKLPIIQCCGIVGGEGTSGAPMFNLRGELVGMLVLESDGYQLGVHVTALKMFLDKLPREDPKEGSELGEPELSKGDVETVGEPSKRMKITK